MPALRTEVLSAASFAPFGDVIECLPGKSGQAINYGRTERHHALAAVEVGEGRAILNIFRTKPVQDGFALRVIERHPLGSQAFMPLSPYPYAVVVAPPGDFDPTALRAFLASPAQGVNYHAGTWHHYCLALEGESDFLVVDREGPGDNCDEIQLTGDYTLKIERS